MYSAATMASLLQRVGLFPLPEATLLPAQLMPLHVFEPRYRQLVEDAIEHGHLIAVPRLLPGYEADYYGCPATVDVCGVGQIVQHEQLSDGRYNVLLRGVARARLVEELESTPYRTARAEHCPDVESSVIVGHESLRREVDRLSRLLLKQLLEPERSLVLSAYQAAAAMGESSAYLAGCFVTNPDHRQQLLEERCPVRRLLTLHSVLTERVRDGGSPDPRDQAVRN